jgi:hypothetical protein
LSIAGNDSQLAATARLGMLPLIRHVGRGKASRRGNRMAKKKCQYDQAGRQDNHYAQHKRLNISQRSMPSPTRRRQVAAVMLIEFLC